MYCYDSDSSSDEERLQDHDEGSNEQRFFRWKKRLCRPNDITLEFAKQDDERPNSSDTLSAIVDCESKSKLQRRLALYNSGNLADVTFVVNSARGEERVRAHRFVLAESSSVFEAMFCGPLHESQLEIRLVDTDVETMRMFLYFLYFGEIDISNSSVFNLLYLAEKYDICVLRQMCVSFVVDNLTPNNVVDIFESFDSFAISAIEDSCYDIFDKNTLEVFKSEGFLSAKRDTLNLILKRDTLAVKEADIFAAAILWAKRNMLDQDIDSDDAVKVRLFLGDTFYLIRFGLMLESDFQREVKPYFSNAELNSKIFLLEPFSQKVRWQTHVVQLYKQNDFDSSEARLTIQEEHSVEVESVPESITLIAVGFYSKSSCDSIATVSVKLKVEELMVFTRDVKNIVETEIEMAAVKSAVPITRIFLENPITFKGGSARYFIKATGLDKIATTYFGRDKITTQAKMYNSSVRCMALEEEFTRFTAQMAELVFGRQICQ